MTHSTHNLSKKVINVVMVVFFVVVYREPTQAQELSPPIISEFTLSINQTTVSDLNTDDHIGFGIGVYRTFEKTEHLSLILGLEYNYTHQFKKEVRESESVTRTNTNYYLNALSIPAGIRLTGGNGLRYFVETGLHADIMVQPIRSGTLVETSSSTNSNPKISTFEERAGVSSFWGAYIGLGIQIPVGDRAILIRPDYKLALNSDSLSDFEDLSNNYMRVQVGFRF